MIRRDHLASLFAVDGWVNSSPADNDDATTRSFRQVSLLTSVLVHASRRTGSMGTQNGALLAPSPSSVVMTGVIEYAQLRQ